jgi:hypothetical protein
MPVYKVLFGLTDAGGKTLQHTLNTNQQDLSTAIEKAQYVAGFYQQCCQVWLRTVTVDGIECSPPDIIQEATGTLERRLLVTWGCEVDTTDARKTLLKVGFSDPPDELLSALVYAPFETSEIWQDFIASALPYLTNIHGRHAEKLLKASFSERPRYSLIG